MTLPKAIRALHSRLAARRTDVDPEGGYVLVMMAIMFVVLMMFAGYSVDVSNWNVHRNETQSVAEAAALGGVAFLPDDFATAQLTAEQIAMNHGYALSNISVSLGGGNNQLEVTISQDVPNYFLRVIGNDSTFISNTALAEFEQPVEMGSPEFVLGNDPESGTTPDYWLSIASKNVKKDLGDRFSTETCTPGTANCTGPSNSEYDISGYKYAVRVTDATQPTRIQIFDPAWTWTGSGCNIPDWPDAGEILSIEALDGTMGIPAGYYSGGPGAAGRYAGGDTSYCTGDDRPGSNGPATTFTVRWPDPSPWNDNDNPVVNLPGLCQPETFPAYEPTSIYALPTQSIAELLDPAGADTEWVVDSSDGVFSFAEVFRRWVTICEIPAGSPLGDYIVQVQTTDSTAGQNRFSLRAGPPSGANGVLDVGQSTFSRGRLPIYANTSSANIDFFLARVPPSSGERFLKVSFFDIGDATAAGTLSVVPPVGAIPPANLFTTCEFTLAGVPISTSNCRLPNVLDTNGYGEQVVEVLVTIPSQIDPNPNNRYWCDVTIPSDCWVKVNASFPGGITDSTTWTAELIGDAVRLVPN